MPFLKALKLKVKASSQICRKSRNFPKGRQRIRKRQKLTKIADKSRDGWQVVAEYESDELASGSEDEKRLKKAREAASRKRRQKEQLSSDRGKKPRIALGADNQLFRDKKKSFLFTLYIHMCFGSACASYYRFTTGFITAFIFQAVETLLATSFAVSNAANLDTGPRTVDPCSGREVTSPLATILALESPTTSQPQANQLNQSNEDDLAQVDQITQNYELESGHSLSVKGNLKNNLGFWRSIGAPDFILSIIENGYRLPFISFPLAVKLGNNKSARLHADFVDQAVLELVNSGRVRIVNEQPFVVNPLSVSIQPCGKKRLILDLRHVNKSLIKQSVKYEDWKIAMAYFAKDAHMFSFDLKSGYHHIDIAHEHQTFLGFSWRSSDSVNEVFYVFTVLPFGLSSAPYVFTKVLKPLEKYWRIQGLCIAIFLDDG